MEQAFINGVMGVANAEDDSIVYMTKLRKGVEADETLYIAVTITNHIFKRRNVRCEEEARIDAHMIYLAIKLPGCEHYQERRAPCRALVSFTVSSS